MTPEKLPLSIRLTPNNGKPLRNMELHHPAIKQMTRTQKRAVIRKLRKAKHAL